MDYRNRLVRIRIIRKLTERVDGIFWGLQAGDVILLAERHAATLIAGGWAEEIADSDALPSSTTQRT
jgi:hypothetical protein